MAEDRRRGGAPTGLQTLRWSSTRCLEHQQVQAPDDRGGGRLGRRGPRQGLQSPAELGVGQQPKQAVSPDTGPSMRLLEAGRRLITDLLQPLKAEARGREGGPGGPDGGSTGQNRPRPRPEGEQPRARLGTVREGLTDQHPPTRTNHPAQLASAASQVAEVVDDSRQPGTVTTALPQRHLLAPTADVGDPGVGTGAACLVAHALGWLQGDHGRVEPLGDRGRKQPGAGPQIQHRQPRGRGQVGGQRRPPGRQGLQGHGPIAVVDGGQLVIVHPGHDVVLCGRRPGDAHATRAPTLPPTSLDDGPAPRGAPNDLHTPAALPCGDPTAPRPPTARPFACWTGCHLNPSAVKGRCALMSARSAFGGPLTAPGSRWPGDTGRPGRARTQARPAASTSEAAMTVFEKDWLELGSRVARSLHFQHPATCDSSRRPRPRPGGPRWAPEWTQSEGTTNAGTVASAEAAAR